MWRLAIYRILLAIPTLLIIVSIVFIFSRTLPGDPVQNALSGRGSITEMNTVKESSEYNIIADQLGLNKPVFYFSIVPINYPTDIYRMDYTQKRFAQKILKKYKYPNEIWQVVKFVENLELDENIPTENELRVFLNSYDSDLQKTSAELQDFLQSADSGLVSSDVAKLNNLILQIIHPETRGFSLIPKAVWHGRDNQFHHWLIRTLSFDFGVSNRDGQSAGSKIWYALRWTLLINILAIAIAYFCAIGIGVYSGWKEGIFTRTLNVILYVVYSIPVFWLATILIVFFTTPDYGAWSNIFPSAGIWLATSKDTFIDIAVRNAGQFIIPIFVLGTTLMAYIARIMRNSIMEEKNKEYVTYARVKGLSESRILWYHVFRNSSFPLITMFASVFPAALSGSLVVEVICNIPGMGRLLYDGIIDRDWAVVNGIVVLTALLTIAGLIISDLMYRWADPRLRREWM